MDLVCFHTGPAEASIASGAMHLWTAFILFDTGPTVRAWPHISPKEVELVSSAMLFFARTFMPVKLTQEAGIMSTVCTRYTIGLAFLSNLPLTSELWAPDEIPVIINHSTQPESGKSFVLLLVKLLSHSLI